jgi:hypothetical protein
MPTKNGYPEKLALRTHKLYYEQKKTMKDVLKILKKEYPKFAKRMTVDRLHSVARGYRKKKGLAAKNERMSKSHTKKTTTVSSKRKEIIESARKLRQKNYRWQAIVEELKVQFPKEKIPTAAALSNIVRGKKPKNNNKQYHVSITSPSGVVLNIDISSNKSLEKIVSQLLEA